MLVSILCSPTKVHSTTIINSRWHWRRDIGYRPCCIRQPHQYSIYMDEGRVTTWRSRYENKGERRELSYIISSRLVSPLLRVTAQLILTILINILQTTNESSSMDQHWISLDWHVMTVDCIRARLWIPKAQQPSTLQLSSNVSFGRSWTWTSLHDEF